MYKDRDFNFGVGRGEVVIPLSFWGLEDRIEDVGAAFVEGLDAFGPGKALELDLDPRRLRPGGPLIGDYALEFAFGV